MSKNNNKEYFEYLDALRDSGVTNMFGAVPYLMNEFPELSMDEARNILKNWMNTYSERHETVTVNLNDILDIIMKKSK